MLKPLDSVDILEKHEDAGIYAVLHEAVAVDGLVDLLAVGLCGACYLVPGEVLDVGVDQSDDELVEDAKGLVLLSNLNYLAFRFYIMNLPGFAVTIGMVDFASFRIVLDFPCVKFVATA
jgi:hypothetical protein